ncbi:MAG TPA: transposase [Armatimonadota bacterium]|jgi:REP element-mobilizing transposase RayT
MSDRENSPEQLPSRLNRRPRLDSSVYGPSGYACHLITNTHAGRPVLTETPAAALLVVDCLRAAAQAQGIELLAYCVMSSHVHIIALVRPQGTDLVQFMKSFKMRVSRRLRAGPAEKLWQESFYDRVLRQAEHLPTACEYVLNNAVKEGGAENWKEYPYAWLSPEVGS